VEWYWEGNWSTGIKACFSATFSTTNPSVQAWDWSWVSMMIGCQLTAWTMKQAVKMSLQCECVQWLLHVTWHTVCDCVTVQMSVHRQTLYSSCTTLCVWNAQVATLLLHQDRWPAFTNSCTDNGSTWSHCQCHRTCKHKQFHYK